MMENVVHINKRQIITRMLRRPRSTMLRISCGSESLAAAASQQLVKQAVLENLVH